MSTQPEALTVAAGTLRGIGSATSAQNTPAAAPKDGVVSAAADEVSALAARAGSYAATKAANAITVG